MRAALAPFLCVICALPAFAQDAEIQKQLIQRQQQSDAFNLQLRQSQEALKAPAAAKPALESRQLQERQRLENVSERQRLEVKPDAPQELRPYERQKAESERRDLASPAVAVPVAPPPTPAPLQPALKGSVDGIDAPR